MNEPDLGRNPAQVTPAEHVSNAARENAKRLTANVETLANQIERLDDPAGFHTTLSQLKPVE